MLEPLAGRLKWERIGHGIRVVIPVRFPLLDALTGISLLTLPVSTIFLFGKHQSLTGLSRFIPIGIGFVLCVGWFVLVFTIKHVLTLNPAEMTVQTRTFGIGVRSRTYATSRLQNLRFVASEYGDWISIGDMSRIEIDRDFKTRKLAFGISEREADALIEKMTAIYDFRQHSESKVEASVKEG